MFRKCADGMKCRTAQRDSARLETKKTTEKKNKEKLIKLGVMVRRGDVRREPISKLPLADTFSNRFHLF